jgi:8-oxo-dGTP pyrophosphatase MutT (NUDIX family)
LYHDFSLPVNHFYFAKGVSMMEYRGRAQCLVIRDDKILMVKHKHGGDEWYCTPGGGIEPGETPDQAALRELQEECNVTGAIIRQASEWQDPYDADKHYTYQIGIGEQTPSLGYDPELAGNQILAGVRWLALHEITEVDRAYLWAAGLLSIPQFAAELDTWAREISYPGRRILDQEG